MTHGDTAEGSPSPTVPAMSCRLRRSPRRDYEGPQPHRDVRLRQMPARVGRPGRTQDLHAVGEVPGESNSGGGGSRPCSARPKTEADLAGAADIERTSTASQGWWLARRSSESSGMPTFALCATVGRLRESRERSLEAAGVGLPRSSNSRMISRTRWSQLARNDRKPWCKYKTSTADPPASARIPTPRAYETGTCLPTHRSKRSR
jgi:hypothetical protein